MVLKTKCKGSYHPNRILYKFGRAKVFGKGSTKLFFVRDFTGIMNEFTRLFSRKTFEELSFIKESVSLALNLFVAR